MEDSRVGAPAGGTDLFSAVGRNIVLFLAPIVIFAGIGVAYGIVRKPVYTAEARVSVGQLNVSTQGIPGFLVAAQNLAAAYSRAIDAPQVTKPAAKAAGISESRAAGELTASAVPSTPLFRIEAKDTGKARSVTLANTAADALIKHVLDLNRRANIRGEILAKYNRAAIKVSQIQHEIGRTQPTAKARVSLTARLQKAILRRNALGNIYNTSSAGEVAENLLQVISPAANPNGDRDTVTERWGLIGALAGLLLGLALAAGRESRRQRATAATA
jgi:uncharacterized protein involved in exopolysaccharide biosynthesis